MEGKRESLEGSSIAIVGMAGVFPGANDPETLWQNILAARREFRKIPSERLPLNEYYSPDLTTPDKTYCDQVAVITDWSFDPLAFGIPPVTWAATDRTHWLALWVARAALENAKVDIDAINRDRVAVILGNSLGGDFGRSVFLRLRAPYAVRALKRSLEAMDWIPTDKIQAILDRFHEQFVAPLPAVTEDSLAGTMANTIAGQICNHFDIGGGGFTVDGACASSLLAVAEACEVLSRNQQDIVLCGGVDISLDPYELVGFAKTKALAADDIRPFDARAAGMLPGEGCGVFVLMREQDAIEAKQPIRALIRGWGLASDGASGLTAPRREGQVRAMKRAYKRAGYEFSTVKLVEAHGTGTTLGDQVELRAVLELLGGLMPSAQDVSDAQTKALSPCYIGSIKGNIGHCKAAAGSAALMKAVLALEHKMVPPTTGCEIPHPLFAQSSGRLAPALEGQWWPAGETRRRAAVSAFGFGGVDTHITIEEADPYGTWDDADAFLASSGQKSEMIVISADDLSLLRERVDQIRGLCDRISRSELTDLSGALTKEYCGGCYRIAIVARDQRHLAALLNRVIEAIVAEQDFSSIADSAAGLFVGIVDPHLPPPSMVMLFPGQGTQRPGMARHLLRRYAEVQALSCKCDIALADIQPEGFSHWLLEDPRLDGERRADQLTATELAQPAIVMASLITCHVLALHGLTPNITLGHSLGMISALCAKGAFDVPTAVKIAALRGRAMAQLPLADSGDMVAILADPERVAELLLVQKGDLIISNYNSPRQTVVSGNSQGVSALCAYLAEQGVSHRKLNVSHAFHSRFVASAAETFCAAISDIDFSTPAPSVVSTMTGDLLSGGEDLRTLLGDHIQRPVTFTQAVQCAASQTPDLWVEVGPGRVLCDLTRDILGSDAAVCHTTDCAQEDGSDQLNRLLSHAYVLGFPVDLGTLFKRRFHRPFSIDGYAPEMFVNPCERSIALSPCEYRDDPAVAPLIEEVAEAGEDQCTSKERLVAFALDWLANRSGFPREQLTPKLRLRSDLNLDSIKATELVQALISRCGFNAVSAPGLLNAPVAEIVDTVLAGSSNAENKRDGASLLIDRSLLQSDISKDWIKCFEMTTAASPLADETVLEQIFPKAVAVVAPRETSRVSAVVNTLIEKGLAPYVTNCKTLASGKVSSEVGAVVWLIPPNRLDRKPAAISEQQLPDNIDDIYDIARFAVRVREKHGTRLLWLVIRFDNEPGEATAKDCGAALLKSLQQEHPGLVAKWVKIPAKWASEHAAGIIADELFTMGHRILYGYLPDGQRYCHAASVMRFLGGETQRPLLASNEVSIVTGGARGITARLAKQLGATVGGTLVLLGRSPSDMPEVQQTLRMLQDASLNAHYFSCNVCDRDALAKVVSVVREAYGTPRAILHGAGISSPIPFVELTQEVYRDCIRVKVVGLANLLSVCPLSTLKLLHVISSVVAHTGMANQADYALANAWVDGYLAEIERSHPELQAISLAYTLWSEVGMGHNLGAVLSLRDLGISTIDNDTGEALYRKLLLSKQAQGRVVLTGYLAPQLEAMLHMPPPQDKKRFLEKWLRWIPGVELIAEATLSHDADRYLADHVVNGTPILPAVMGIEAMTTTAMACAMRSDVPVLKDIVFRRPIAVPKDATHRIRIAARVLTPAVSDKSAAHQEELVEDTTVTAMIFSESDGFSDAMFSARCCFASNEATLSQNIVLPDKSPMNVEERDGQFFIPVRQFIPELLFQGPTLQSIKGFTHILPETSCESVLFAPGDAPLFGADKPQELSTSSPGLRDGALQSALPLLGCVAVATRIDELRMYESPRKGKAVRCAVRYLSKQNNRTQVDIQTFTEDAKVIDVMRGVAFDTIPTRAYATPIAYHELVPSLLSKWPDRRFAAAVVHHDEKCLESRNRVQVAEHNMAALREAARILTLRYQPKPFAPDSFSLSHNSTGKPHLIWKSAPPAEFANLGISLSDTRGVSVAAVGSAAIGVDIEPVVMRNAAEWYELLGMDGYGFMLHIVGKTREDLSTAATRTWTILEAVFKAVATRPILTGCTVEVDGPWLKVRLKELPGGILYNVCVRSKAGSQAPFVSFSVVTKSE